MKGWVIALIVIAVIAIIIFLLYRAGKKLLARQNEQQEMLESHKQTVSLLVIDKKRMKMKDANLPANIMEQVPKMQRNLKVPLAKVKAGPQILTMFVDEKIFDALPVKKEVKAEVSGMYIMGVKGVHGTVVKKEEKKKGFLAKAIDKAQEKAGAKPIK